MDHVILCFDDEITSCIYIMIKNIVSNAIIPMSNTKIKKTSNYKVDTRGNINEAKLKYHLILYFKTYIPILVGFILT